MPTYKNNNIIKLLVVIALLACYRPVWNSHCTPRVDITTEWKCHKSITLSDRRSIHHSHNCLVVLFFVHKVKETNSWILLLDSWECNRSQHVQVFPFSSAVVLNAGHVAVSGVESQTARLLLLIDVRSTYSTHTQRQRHPHTAGEMRRESAKHLLNSFCLEAKSNGRLFQIGQKRINSVFPVLMTVSF